MVSQFITVMVKILLHLWLVIYYIYGWSLLHLWLIITLMGDTVIRGTRLKPP